jgi:GTP-binding protein Era
MVMNKAAFIALAGRPSVGKSTLVNLLCGAKVAIVSQVPQTTRNAVRGILTQARGQLVFVDTPGRHVSEKKFNKKLMDVSDRALGDTDLVLYVLDAARSPGPEEEAVAERLKGLQNRTVAAINKCDAAGAEPKKLLGFLEKSLPDLSSSRCFEISCFKKEGIDPLLECLFEMAAEGENLYPEEYYTDQDMGFRIQEIIREKAMNRLREELPHSIYVEVADLEFREALADTSGEISGDGKKRLWVRAFIITERESQKGMIVGKGGEMIKAIGQAARKELNSIFDWKVDLDLRVKTGKDWRHNDRVLKKITGS